MHKIIPFLLFLPLYAQGEIIQETFHPLRLDTLIIQNQTGDIEIFGTGKKTASIHADKSENSAHCAFTAKLMKNKLYLETRTNLADSTKPCITTLRVHVPQQTNILVKNGNGKTQAHNIQNKASFQVGNGDVIITESKVKKLNVNLGNGNLTAEKIIGSTTIKIGNGNVNLTYAKVPKAGQLTITTGNGDATIHIPQNAKFKTQFRSGDGQIYTRLAQNQSANFLINMRAGVGNLTIKKK